MVQEDEAPPVRKAPARRPTSQMLSPAGFLLRGLVVCAVAMILTGGSLVAGVLGFGVATQLIRLNDLVLVGAVLGAALGLSWSLYLSLQSGGTIEFDASGVLWRCHGALVGWIVRSVGQALGRSKRDTRKAT